MGRCARIGHILLIANTYLVAILVGTYYTDLVQDLPGVELDYDCSGGYYESCHLVSDVDTCVKFWVSYFILPVFSVKF